MYSFIRYVKSLKAHCTLWLGANDEHKVESESAGERSHGDVFVLLTLSSSSNPPASVYWKYFRLIKASKSLCTHSSGVLYISSCLILRSVTSPKAGHLKVSHPPLRLKPKRPHASES